MKGQADVEHNEFRIGLIGPEAMMVIPLFGNLSAQHTHRTLVNIMIISASMLGILAICYAISMAYRHLGTGNNEEYVAVANTRFEMFQDGDLGTRHHPNDQRGLRYAMSNEPAASGNTLARWKANMPKFEEMDIADMKPLGCL
ncbi:hypothetical protein T440DRAFT_517741 [Plenodomus tracheiphilus IPT5]|uniref:Uncharacterized protein n=1 Tax=Plenodomus tracheiphilus IPT5 TaxID=1408161 RepID=A0A6A7B971_9PLEO|nr:hypothetical protein T440DRAFT_517741 [Plenodomus tracheiphilus IPT5]